MRDLAPSLIAVTTYIGLLFLLAVWVERRARRGRNAADNALVYSLAQAVYATTWTYYGSSGFAVSRGLLFLTVYLGPTLAMIFSGSVLRKLVRIKQSHGVTSIADFISARYGKSQAVGTLATIIVVVGLVPYLSLQLKTMIGTAAIMSHKAQPYPEVGRVIGPVLVLVMVVFTISFGIRRLSPTERHPGMMVALATECVVKLAAFLLVGAFVTFYLFDGFGDLLGRAQSLPTEPALAGRNLAPPLPTWLSHLLLSASAILFLPRQFHVAVVENSDERHIQTASWLLPLYLMAICIFALPIATAGIATGMSPREADNFVLALPFGAHQPWLSWVVFLGGFSAGTAMVMIETTTIATMVSNHLLLPLVDVTPRFAFLRRHIRPFRWAAAAAIISAAFVYERLVSWRYEIVVTGLVSFAAVFQFAPAILVGLYWKQASKIGALMGMAGGFLVWAYTLILPLLARGGFIDVSLLERGPFGITGLRPEALFGIGGFDPITHAVLWSLTANLGLYMVGSLLWPPTEEQVREADRMIHTLTPEAVRYSGVQRPALIDVGTKRRELERLLATTFAEAEVSGKAAAIFRAAGIETRRRMSILELAQLEAEVELTLARVIGAAAAHVTLKRHTLIDPAEALELSQAYASMLADLKVSPAELRRKVDYHRARASLMAKQASTFHALADAGRRLSSSLEYDTTARTVAAAPVPWLVPAALVCLVDRDGQRGSPPRLVFAHREADTQEKVDGLLALSSLTLDALPHVANTLASCQPEVALTDLPENWPPPLSGMVSGGSLTLPLVVRREALGTLTLFTDEGSPFRYPDDLAVSQELAYRCAVALDNAGMFERTQEAVRARDEFMAVASHELRTPLTPLKLQIQILDRLLMRGELATVPHERLLQSLRSCDAQLSRLSRLVDNLLDISRISSGRLRLSLEDADLSEIAAEVVTRYREELNAAGCPTALDLAPGVVGRWDRLRLEQVVTNLLTNAAKYAAGRPIEIRTISVNDRAQLVVRDHGPGIPKDDQRRIFRPFERGVSFRNLSGFGLGLYIVRQVVDAHGGRVLLDSAPGRGCTFTVELPMELRTRSAAGEARLQPAASPLAGPPPT
jgi:signal transduction histidine kinase/Na+/proline symporter